MKKESKAKKLIDQSLDILANELEKGKSESLTNFLKSMSRFHNYSFGNQMLIRFQRPNATLVAGFHAWKKMERYVKKGEMGIVILCPVVSRWTETDDNGEEVEETVIRFVDGYVFDVEQTDGKELPEFAHVSGSPEEYTTRLIEMIKDRRIELEYVQLEKYHHGTSYGGKIKISDNLTPAHQFSTFVHELAHELLHREERRTQTDKTIRETEAEAVAFVVCDAIGLETNGQHSDYIKLWGGDKDTLKESLEYIRNTASMIIGWLLEEKEHPIAA